MKSAQKTVRITLPHQDGTARINVTLPFDGFVQTDVLFWIPRKHYEGVLKCEVDVTVLQGVAPSIEAQTCTFEFAFYSKFGASPAKHG